MDRWYVLIEHLTQQQLEFLGYQTVTENEEFIIVRHYTGDEHIISKESPRFLFVDDINDVAAIHTARMIPAPEDED